jgi:hypothetical protein
MELMNLLLTFFVQKLKMGLLRLREVVSNERTYLMREPSYQNVKIVVLRDYRPYRIYTFTCLK